MLKNKHLTLPCQYQFTKSPIYILKPVTCTHYLQTNIFQVVVEVLERFYAYVCCPEGSAPKVNQIDLAQPKDMYVRENNFIAFLNDLNWMQEQGKPANHLGT